MRENIRLGLILFAVTAIAGLCLGFAHEITRVPIEKQIAETNNNAMREVLPGASEFKLSDVLIPGETIVKEVNEGYKDGKQVGYAIKVTPKGYGGIIEMMVGISNDGTLQGIKILSHSETPGLGANAPKPKFSDQFKNKPIDAGIEVVTAGASQKNQVDAMTGATITSKSVTNGVNQAIKFYTSNLKGGQK